MWLCRPGSSPDPCDVNLDATSVGADGRITHVSAAPATETRFDCFYVYPTVSEESGLNSDLKIQQAEIDSAAAQAARFSQVCRVWAPMYRQVTVAGLLAQTKLLRGEKVAYQSLLSAWKDYITHDNDGRPIIFIGHSQGTVMLIDLLRQEVDDNPGLRARTVSAILLGGNVQVPVGKAVGGTFKHLPLCRAAAELHCVIAYSTFDKTPPANSLFGRPGSGVSLLSGQTISAGQQVACVNPANLASPSSPSPELPYVLQRAPGGKRGVWTTYPGAATAACRSADGATWLQVSGTPEAKHLPRLRNPLPATWGLHLYDVTLSLGNLVNDVRAQEAAYFRGSHAS